MAEYGGNGTAFSFLYSTGEDDGYCLLAFTIPLSDPYGGSLSTAFDGLMADGKNGSGKCPCIVFGIRQDVRTLPITQLTNHHMLTCLRDKLYTGRTTVPSNFGPSSVVPNSLLR